MAVALPLQSETIRLPDALEEIQAYFHAHGLTDGLPIMPPTPQAVQNMLAYTDLPPHEVIAALPPRKGQATVEKIAINAVMAGCLPQYLPVVIAAIQALAGRRLQSVRRPGDHAPLHADDRRQRSHCPRTGRQRRLQTPWGRAGAATPPSGGPCGW